MKQTSSSIQRVVSTEAVVSSDTNEEAIEIVSKQTDYSGQSIVIGLSKSAAISLYHQLNNLLFVPK